MKRKLLYGLLFISIFLLLGAAVMFLWNALLPQTIHVSVISYLQALGLMVLCRILFGKLGFSGWMGGRHDDSPRSVLKEKLMTMDEGDRATFKEEWRKRCEGKT